MNLTLDIFAEQYITEYAKLAHSHRSSSIEYRMKLAKEITVEYLYLKLKEGLDIDIVWPPNFKLNEDEN